MRKHYTRLIQQRYQKGTISAHGIPGTREKRSSVGMGFLGAYHYNLIQAQGNVGRGGIAEL